MKETSCFFANFRYCHTSKCSVVKTLFTKSIFYVIHQFVFKHQGLGRILLVVQAKKLIWLNKTERSYTQLDPRKQVIAFYE